MNFLLDTCIISELVAKNPNQQVLYWLDELADEHVFLSVLTIGEIQRGIWKLTDSSRKKSLINWLEIDLLNRFKGRVLMLDIDVMLRWGELVANSEKIGHPVPAIDSLLAAQAATYGMTLVTRNIKDFVSTGIDLFNPWQSE